MPPRRLLLLSLLGLVLALSGLSGATAEDAPLITAPVLVSDASPYAPGCGGGARVEGGINVRNGVAEPRLGVNPRDPLHIVAVWQQDRWSDGGAAGVRAGVSRDGGRS